MLTRKQINNGALGGSLIGGTGLAAAVPGSAWAASAQNIPGASLVAQRTPLMTMGVASLPAAIGLSAYSHAITQGELMDEARKDYNSALSQQMREIRDAAKLGYAIDDEGNYINTNPNRIDVKTALTQNDLNAFNALANQRAIDEAAWQIRDNALLQNTDEEEAAYRNATERLVSNITKNTSSHKSTEKNAATEDENKVKNSGGNSLDPLMGLLSLLALGGGAYYLGKKL